MAAGATGTFYLHSHTRWNTSAERLSILLSDIHGKIDIQVSVLDERDQLVRFMRKLREEGEQYRQ